MSVAAPTPKTLLVFGTRPEAVKLAPVYWALRASGIEPVCVSTGQHREMLAQMVDVLDLRIDDDLRLMRERQSLTELSAGALTGIASVIERVAPSVVLVQGDTSSACAAAIAGYYAGVPVGHVEAGLRSGRIDNPFPEEGNRRIIGQVSRWHFCPTEAAAANLRRERIPGEVLVTGNTVIDALLSVQRRTDVEVVAAGLVPEPAPGERRVLVTLHRRESQGDAQRRLAQMLVDIAEEHRLQVVWPVHLSPAVRDAVLPGLGESSRVVVTDPLDYVSFVSVLSTSSLVISDSGGVQEEAPSLDVPVVVLRDTTERQEGIAAGCAVLAGTEPEAAGRVIRGLLVDETRLASMASAANPYGDGLAAERIVAHLERAIAGEGRHAPIDAREPVAAG